MKTEYESVRFEKDDWDEWFVYDIGEDVVKGHIYYDQSYVYWTDNDEDNTAQQLLDIAAFLNQLNEEE